MTPKLAVAVSLVVLATAANTAIALNLGKLVNAVDPARNSGLTRAAQPRRADHRDAAPGRRSRP